MSACSLPDRPNLRQLKVQAKELLAEARRSDPAARLSDAQLEIARRYGLSSWPRLVAICRVIHAMWTDDFGTVRGILSATPQLFEESASDASAGWRDAMTQAANHALRRIITLMREQGVRGVEAAMARPDMHPWLDTLRLLGRVGARPPRSAFGGAVELLQGADFAFMAEVGASIRDEGGERPRLVALALETYTRNPRGKRRILEVMGEQGVPFPDTAPMAVHRGRVDLLDSHLRRDPLLLTRTFTHGEIWPPELGCHEEHDLALHGAPLAGATLLHMAADYEELEIAKWLLDHGMNVDVRADVDGDGLGGHTPLFNCVVGYNAGRRDDPIARLLLDRGADANARASIRKALAFSRDPSPHEYRDVTPVGWARQFHDQSYVCQAAVRLIAERGGRE